TEDFEEGLARRTQLLGEAYVTQALHQAPEFNRDIQQYVTEAVWGKVWSGGELPVRERILVTVSLICAMGKTTEMKVHLRNALRNGIKPEELKALFFHVAGYCGAPAALECYRAYHEVVAGMAAETAKAGTTPSDPKAP
ncbi:MAG TPA: carboxymuconolactone decarboxylase family protein, partial [Solimonas sp.]|nr:carboxymuconolactone decarboxylase family protein [Solimonas sp.]